MFYSSSSQTNDLLVIFIWVVHTNRDITINSVDYSHQTTKVVSKYGMRQSYLGIIANPGQKGLISWYSCMPLEYQTCHMRNSSSREWQMNSLDTYFSNTKNYISSY